MKIEPLYQNLIPHQNNSLDSDGLNSPLNANICQWASTMNSQKAPLLDGFWIKLQAFSLQETPTQMLSCEVYETFKNTYFEEHLQTTAYGGVL